MGKQSRTSGYYLINTIAHPDVTKYYDNYYRNGKKRVCKDVIHELDLLGLSIWLADDGSFSLHGKNKTCLRGSIATCSFNKDEIYILMETFGRFFDGSIAFDSYNNTIRLGKTIPINNLINKITNILPKNIHYKFVPQRLHAKPL